jgi:hypothetical protein
VTQGAKQEASAYLKVQSRKSSVPVCTIEINSKPVDLRTWIGVTGLKAKNDPKAKTGLKKTSEAK